MRIKLLRKTLPFVIGVLGLALAGAISFAFHNSSQGETKEEVAIFTSPSSSPQSEPTPTPSIKPSPSVTPLIKKLTTPQPSPSSTPVVSTQPVQTEQTSSSTPIQTNDPTPSPVPQKLSVSVSIDGANSFTVLVDEGRNHCDVLSQALQEGKISGLNMQYNPTYNSYAVYQINGLGKEDQVWWGYKVNEKSPPLGCSHISVQSNDNVRWTYVGAR